MLANVRQALRFIPSRQAGSVATKNHHGNERSSDIVPPPRNAKRPHASPTGDPPTACRTDSPLHAYRPVRRNCYRVQPTLGCNHASNPGLKRPDGHDLQVLTANTKQFTPIS
jgi:hypothetical protein